MQKKGAEGAKPVKDENFLGTQIIILINHIFLIISDTEQACNLEMKSELSSTRYTGTLF